MWIYDLPAYREIYDLPDELLIYESHKCKFFDIDALIPQNAAEGGEKIKVFKGKLYGF